MKSSQVKSSQVKSKFINFKLIFILLFSISFLQISCQKESSETIPVQSYDIKSIINQIKSKNTNQVHGRSGSSFSYLTFNSFEELEDTLAYLNSLSLSDLIINEDIKEFFSYKRLFETIINEETLISDSLDLYYKNILILDTASVKNVYDNSHSALITEYSDYIEIVTNSSGEKNLEPSIMDYDVSPIINPLGIVVVDSILVHFHSDGVDYYPINPIGGISDTFKAESLKKYLTAQENRLEFSSRGINDFTKRCEHSRNGFKIIVEHFFRQNDISSRPGNSITTFFGQVRSFKKKLFGAWWDIHKANQLRVDWWHTGNIVTCDNPSQPGFFPQNVNFSGSGSDWLLNGHTFGKRLPVNPGWPGFECTSNPIVSQSFFRGEAIMGKDNYLLNCSVNHN